MSRRNLRSAFKAHLFDATGALCFVGDDLDGGAGGGADEGPSLRDELAAAWGADSASDGPSEVAPLASETTAANPTPPPADDGRARDGQGRFAPKAEAPQSQTEPKTPQASAAPVTGQQAQPQTSAPPPSWSAAAKAEFAKASPVIQQEVLKREADIERGKAQWQQGAEQLNRLTTAIGPRAQRWRMGGFSVEQGIQRLVAAEEALETDPLNALAHLAQVYGVDLRTIAGRTQAQQPQHQLPPWAQPLVREVQTLKGALAQQRQSADQANLQAAGDQVQAFRSDPAHKYFDNVAVKVAAMLESGQAKDLEDAYQQATWADPQVRAALLQEQEAARQAQNADAARAKAAQARHASGSVTGSPTPGSAGRGGPDPNASVRDTLAAAWDQHAA